MIRDCVQPDDAARTHPAYTIWRHVVPLPPPGLIASTGGSTVENFLVVGEAWAQVIGRHLAPTATVLDVGCGCGKTARRLVGHPYVESYVGFDVIRESIEWCRRFIAPLAAGRFRFEHYDLYSAQYNPTGALRARDLVFPVGDGSVTVAFAASVFTHLLEPDARHYLREIARVLTADGRAVLSIHDAPPADISFAGDESRIDVSPEYFQAMAEAAGLELIEPLGELCGQRAFVFGSRRAGRRQ